MGDQLARLLADNVSRNAEIQNLDIRVLPAWRGLWSFLLLISALCREMLCYFSLVIIPYCSLDRYRGSFKSGHSSSEMADLKIKTAGGAVI